MTPSATAEKLVIPVTVNGTLVGPDQDYYRFTAKAGERLGVRSRCPSRRFGHRSSSARHDSRRKGASFQQRRSRAPAWMRALTFTFAQAGEYLGLGSRCQVQRSGSEFLSPQDWFLSVR